MRGFIMAGGMGKRLGPLTADRPKPLIPLLGEPVMGYVLKLLSRHGVRGVTATVCWQAEQLTAAFQNGVGYHLSLDYHREKEPLGTAGGIRAAALNETAAFVVMSGDCLTDWDLTAMLDFHQSSGAMLTMGLTRAADASAYGMVEVDAGGRVIRFEEKPEHHAGEALVNTGIYIIEPEVLELIPADQPYDFGRQLLPWMIEQGLPLYGCEQDSYWCDVGCQETYLAAQQDLLLGRLTLPLRGRRNGQIVTSGLWKLAPDVVIQGPCYIGRGVTVASHAVLSGGTVLMDRAHVGEGAKLTGSCLWPGAVAEANAILSGAVLCQRARAMAGTVMRPNSALGTAVVLPLGAHLGPNEKRYPDGAP